MNRKKDLYTLTYKFYKSCLGHMTHPFISLYAKAMCDVVF